MFRRAGPPLSGECVSSRDMADPFVSGDPNAWLRPYWQRLHQQQSFFANLAPELQANALADALSEGVSR